MKNERLPVDFKTGQMELTDRSYWHSHSENLIPVGKHNEIRKWLLKYIPEGNGDCFEIGCMPGTYLTVFGELGYRLNGLDYVGNVDTDLPIFLNSLGYRVGEFYKVDFRDFKPLKKYEIVCSFGFIEHFVDWESIFIKHIDMVKEGGYLVITSPNFNNRVKLVFHKLFDRRALDRHNLEAIDLARWQILAKEKGFRIITSGYFGKYIFWITHEKKGIAARVQYLMLMAINVLFSLFSFKKTKNFSAHCGLIAKKESCC